MWGGSPGDSLRDVGGSWHLIPQIHGYSCRGLADLWVHLIREDRKLGRENLQLPLPAWFKLGNGKKEENNKLDRELNSSFEMSLNIRKDVDQMGLKEVMGENNTAFICFPPGVLTAQ